MSENKEKLAELEDVEVEPLSDEDLDSVAGGEDCSCCWLLSGCTSSRSDLEA